MVNSPATVPRTVDWHLRVVLLVVLAGLAYTALIVTATRSPARTPAALRHSTRRHRPHTTTSTTPTTTVPGALTGTVTRPRAGGGCGFSLLGQAQPRPTGHAKRHHGAASVTTTTTLATAPVGHCTVLEIGDSLGNDLGWGIGRHVTASSGLKLVQKDVSSTGLAVPSFFNWQATLAADLRTYHPQLVLICLGGNDQQGIVVDGNVVQFPAAAWQHAYLARVRSLVTEAVDAGAYVAWVGLPIMQQPSYSQGARILDTLYQEGTTSAPNATYISTWSLFSNPQGTFQSNAEVNGAPTTLRQSDGIHYSFAGEDVIATYVLREMALIYHVQLVPTDPTTITSWS